MSDAPQSQLQAYYTRAFPAKQRVQISNLASITPGGMEHEMYAFDVEYGPAGERQQEGLLLRRAKYDGIFGRIFARYRQRLQEQSGLRPPQKSGMHP